ncbi:MAG TPA: sel1 repeat family protein [Gammaproteobacteria bacterium]|nr:sel1 repeat family protein [Gammaproteobacteria bacterium]
MRIESGESVAIAMMTMIKRASYLYATIAFLAGPPVMAEDNQAIHARALAAYQAENLFVAMNLLEKPAREGYTPSMVLLAYILDKAEENERAFSLYQRAAARGDPEAMHGLAGMYLSGEGVKQNQARGYALMEAAGRKGLVKSMRAMAMNYQRGAPGLKADARKARMWWEMAAAAGDKTAIEKLAEMDMAAKGVER